MKSIKKNYLLNASYQVMNMIIPLVTAPYISRVLEADGVGTYSFVCTVVSYFVLFATLGTATYGSREIAFHDGERKKQSVVFWEVEILSILTVFTVGVLFLLMVFVVKANRLLFVVCGIQILGVAFDISWLFVGVEDFKTIVVRNYFVKLLCVIGIFMFVKTKSDIWIYALLSCGIPAIGNLLAWSKIGNYVDIISFRKLKPFLHLKGTFLLFLPTVSIQIYLYIDKLMIGLLTTSSFENGYYEQAVKIAKLVQVLVTSLGAVVMPRIGKLYEQQDDEAIEELIYKSFNFAWFISIPLCLGLVGIAPTLIPIFLGKEFNNSIILLEIMAWIVIIVGLNNILATQYLIPTKRQNIFTIIVTIGMIVNLGLNLYFIPHYLSVGAAVSTIVSEFVILLMEIFYVRTKFSILRIIKMSWKYWVAGLLMFLVVFGIEQVMTISIIKLLTEILIGASLYFLILFMLRDKVFLEYTKAVAEKISRKG